MTKKARPKVQYTTTWRNKWLTSEAQTIQQMAEGLHAAATVLEKMAADGVMLDLDGGAVDDDYACLVTTDPTVAKKHGMQPDDFDEDFVDDPN